MKHFARNIYYNYLININTLRIDLYLPPRSRKTLQQINQGEGRGRKRKKADDDEESDDVDDSGSEGDGSDDDRPKKRGRPRVTPRENIKSFTDVEIRRFIKSYKKFPAPLKRLDDIAADAELQEKPLPELKFLSEQLRARSETCLTEYESVAPTKENKTAAAGAGDDDKGAGRKRGRRPTFKLGGVMVNAKSLSAAVKELEPLDRSRQKLDSISLIYYANLARHFNPFAHCVAIIFIYVNFKHRKLLNFINE